MIVTGAVVPHPPLLVPELASSAAEETAVLRDACIAAARVLAAASTTWWAVGVGPVPGVHEPAARGTFAGFGVDVRVALGPGRRGPGRPDPELPLPLLVAGWLRGQADAPDAAVHGLVLDPETSPAECVRRGERLAAGPEPVALLVVGDGAATHTARAPGAFDPRAAGYDAGVAAALRDGDPAALAALDPGLSDQLWVGGRVAWQVLAGAVPRPARSELLHSSAPFGVAYHVAVWEP